MLICDKITLGRQRYVGLQRDYLREGKLCQFDLCIHVFT